MISYKSISLLCVCFISFASTQHDEGDHLYDKIFTLPNAKLQLPKLDPSETLKILKSLQELYKSPEDEIAKKRKEQVDELVIESEYDSDSCKPQSLANWGHLAKLYEYYSGSLSPYLDHVKHERFAFCQRLFTSRLGSGINCLTQEQTNQISLLRTLVQDKSCAKIDSPFTVISTDSMAEAIIEFMQRGGYFHPETFKDKRTAQDNMSKKVEEVVGRLCNAVKRELDTSIEISSYYTGYADLVEMLDSTSKDWITNSRVCRAYLIKTGYVLSKTYELYSSGNKKSLSDRLKGCIRPKV